MLSVKQIFIYPVKSMKGIALPQANAQASGFEHDRVLMLSETNGTFITARKYPMLLKCQTALINNQIEISLPVTSTTRQTMTVDLADFSSTGEPTEVWGNHFTAQIAPIRINRFLSDFLQKDVQLRWVGATLSRRVKRYPDTALSFADGYPYLLLNRASFDYLQQHCPEKLDIRQFRGNIIVDGALPFAEDGWQTIKIGNVIFDLVKPCSRCVLSTINVDSATHLLNNEPLNTLHTFRTDQQGDVDFGINMIARHYGTVTVGDQIEVLAHKAAKSYLPVNHNTRKPSTMAQTRNHNRVSDDHASYGPVNQDHEHSDDLAKHKSTHREIKNADSAESRLHKKQPVKQYHITFEGHAFPGNNQQTLLEQLEQHNIQLPYSCRAGICGRCQVTLVSGHVSPLTQSAIKTDQQILACSCIPSSDITLKRASPKSDSQSNSKITLK
ncbi:YcbX family protein [Orbaceae bacterium ESL0727]|nr:YcbX family protein [Orbaceae bacterium ESL0727]